MPIQELSDIRRQGHSWRNFEPEDFLELAENEDKREARKALKYVEDGRFYPMLDQGHNFLSRLDTDEMRSFAEKNQDLVDWIGVWGYLEDLRFFPDLTTVDISAYRYG